jgi:hypothetical protein
VSKGLVRGRSVRPSCRYWGIRQDALIIGARKSAGPALAPGLRQSPAVPQNRRGEPGADFLTSPRPKRLSLDPEYEPARSGPGYRTLQESAAGLLRTGDATLAEVSEATGLNQGDLLAMLSQNIPGREPFWEQRKS